ncbi:D-alanyl-D-alanine carboxypeptidase (penicillin-binding protein 5/6) [Kineothrix alysoides]|uniref:D-alanyl-D-alanine carboxypeptidase (Penicillin-binding protein 5/6) n=1 Tax=Kineothrix alysoides TaxID=1469948 RepID=A0A4R1QWP9_9FIRM|nr:D-alanyl-D-alanine carboxypeptidase family protein [Kineothrix alysoides]TCL57295.1 D-alanyl-D-alanine carboxypeptidase (penicillin-binding protein 5/6) [Kineothrix alysoides]
MSFNHTGLKKEPFRFHKLKKNLCLFTLSAIILSSAFATDIAYVQAVSLDALTEAVENRKTLPIQSNEIENWPTGPQIGAESAIVMEANTGAILYSKNIHEQLYPASTTKILTCLIAAENSSLDEMVTFSHNAVFSIPRGSSNMGMDEGQSISMEECLYGILIGSANEVANAAAEHVGGSIEGFAEMMNEKAKELGCTDSHFANANGLHDDNHYTSAYDLATIARAFYKNELLAKISGMPSYHFEPTATQPDDFILRTHHKIVNNEYPCEGIIGGKTGYTDNARQTLVSCAERNGMKLICVIMKEESPHQFTDTVDLFQYGFNNFEIVNVSENEKNYNIDNADFFQTDNDIFGSSKPVLSLNKGSYLVLPKTAVFQDTQSSISYNVDDDSQIAKIDYTYNGVYVGSATVDIALNTESSYDFDTSIEGTAYDAPEAQNEEPQENIIFVNVKRVLSFILIVAGILIFLFVVKSVIQNYSFAKRRRNRLRRKNRRKDRMRSQYKDFDL